MSGNHRTGLPVEHMLDDPESYRWPTEATTARFEAAELPPLSPADMSKLVRPYVLARPA